MQLEPGSDLLSSIYYFVTEHLLTESCFLSFWWKVQRIKSFLVKESSWDKK